ncbi:MAG: SpoIIE family protein phosphatase [Spirochaetota bacterium]
MAALNIIFFSVMIFENQAELIQDKFLLESNILSTKLVNELQSEIKEKNFSVSHETVGTILRSSGGNVKYLSILEKDSTDDTETKDKEVKEIDKDFRYRVLHTWDKTGKKTSQIDKDFVKKAKSFQTDEISTKTYIKEVDTEDLKIKLLIPIQREDDFRLKLLISVRDGETIQSSSNSIFIYTYIDLQTIDELKGKLWLQIVTALVWGVVFHSLFAIYVYRIIFVRVGDLKDASDRMGGGDLQSRVNWKFRRKDELDNLGLSFNEMAQKIEENIHEIQEKSRKIEEDTKEIVRLNDEINQELEIGKEVQELFLSRKVKFKKFKLAVYYRPMREVSGDIYHFYKLPKHKNSPHSYNAFFFADASGHGVSAALVTVVMILSLDRIVAEGFHPGRVISTLSQVMGDTLQASFFATSVFFLINEKGYVFVSNAGHNAPIVYRPSTGEILRFIESSGPPLGMKDGHIYKTEYFKGEPGDKIFIYSDGLTESPNETEEQFSEERVINIIKENIDKDNKEVLKIMSERLEEFKIEYRDDVSMILLEIPDL